MSETMRKIKNIVELYGWKHKEFAKKVGVTECTMSRWMSGERSPKISDVEKMAKVLDMEIRLYKRGDTV